MSDLRVIPSIEQSCASARRCARWKRATGARRWSRRCAPRPAALRERLASGHVAAVTLDEAVDAIERGADGAAARGDAAVAGARHQRHRRDRPHQSRPRAAVGGGAGPRQRGRRRLHQPGIRSRARRARPARRPRRGAHRASHRRRGGGRRQQQRRGDDAAARGAGGRTRSDHLARRAGRDRRRLPRARRDGAVGRDAARGRARPIARARPTTPRRSAIARRSSCACIRRTSSVVGFTERPSLAELVALGQRFNVPVAEDLGSGWLGWPERAALPERAARRADRLRERRGGRRRRLLQRRQAARRSAGGHHRRTPRRRRSHPASSADARRCASTS